MKFPLIPLFREMFHPATFDFRNDSSHMSVFIPYAVRGEFDFHERTWVLFISKAQQDRLHDVLLEEDQE
jgi:hypothetical protein